MTLRSISSRNDAISSSLPRNEFFKLRLITASSLILNTSVFTFFGGGSLATAFFFLFPLAILIDWWRNNRAASIYTLANMLTKQMHFPTNERLPKFISQAAEYLARIALRGEIHSMEIRVDMQILWKTSLWDTKPVYFYANDTICIVLSRKTTQSQSKQCFSYFQNKNWIRFRCLHNKQQTKYQYNRGYVVTGVECFGSVWHLIKSHIVFTRWISILCEMNSEMISIGIFKNKINSALFYLHNINTYWINRSYLDFDLWSWFYTVYKLTNGDIVKQF